MAKPSMVLVGAGGHARACIDVVEQQGTFAVAGLVGLAEQVGTDVLGYRVLGSDADLTRLLAEHQYALVAVGQIKSPDLRIRLFRAVSDGGCSLPVVVSPRAYVSAHAVVGPGSIVMHGAVVNAGARVGRNCILNSLALIEHDVVIGDHCHVSTSAVVNGGARVGAGTFIGSGSTIREGITIGDRCVIGMGQPVLADCMPGVRLPFRPQTT